MCASIGPHLPTLCSPGVLRRLRWSLFVAQVEQIEDPMEPAAEIVRRCEQKQLMALYKVGAYAGPEDLLRQIAMARGKLKAGGVPVLEVRCLLWRSRPCSGVLACHHAIALTA